MFAFIVATVFAVWCLIINANWYYILISIAGFELFCGYCAIVVFINISDRLA